MFGLLSHFTKAFTGRPAESHHIAHSVAWELPLAPTLCWEAEQTEAIRKCEKQRTFCSVIDPANGDVMQTVILRFNQTTHQVLLDEFFPNPGFSPIGGRFQLNIPAENGLLALQIVVRRQADIENAPAYVAEVVEKSSTAQKRPIHWTRFKGMATPRVELLVPLTPMIAGQLLELSEDEFSMAFCGSDRPRFHARKGECRIYFSDHFVLHTRVQIQQALACRRPFHHTLLKVSFCEMKTTEKDRLLSFLQNFADSQAA